MSDVSATGSGFVGGEARLAGLRVAYVAFEGFPNSKGSGTRIRQMTQALSDAGAEVHLVSLAPKPGAKGRATFLRWLTFLAANFYSTYAISDKPGRFYEDPAGHDMLVKGALARRRALWQLMEAQIKPAQFIVGDTMTVLDIYAAMMSHWSPGRDWFRTNCPSLNAIVERTEAHPVVARVFARNFQQN